MEESKTRCMYYYFATSMSIITHYEVNNSLISISQSYHDNKLISSSDIHHILISICGKTTWKANTLVYTSIPKYIS